MVAKGTKLPPEPLTDDEFRAVVRGISPRCPTGQRNKAMLVVLYRAGLRISECLDLKPADFDAVQGTIRVLHGKGDKMRVVGLDDGACAVVDRWLVARQALGINGHRTLFCTLKGGHMSTNYVRTLLPRLARKAGMTKRVHAHGLRHSYAVGLLADGVCLATISKMLGHTNIATTSRYLDHLDPKAALEEVRRRVWAM